MVNKSKLVCHTVIANLMNYEPRPSLWGEGLGGYLLGLQ